MPRLYEFPHYRINKKNIGAPRADQKAPRINRKSLLYYLNAFPGRCSRGNAQRFHITPKRKCRNNLDSQI